MKRFKILMLVVLCFTSNVFAQEKEEISKEDRLSYYEQHTKEVI
ncbi:hypothetical protein [Pontimicrobium sp. SW4]|uniref:Uncharacterized protein n=1 Tax=Pontimicrobium sp. SW4 TaxID=3153519 RepID=A0AAU7BQH6_9FLAO